MLDVTTSSRSMHTDRSPSTGAEAPRCPVCGGKSHPLHDPEIHDYRSCPDCTHQFLDFEPDDSHAEQHFDDDYFAGEGDGYPDYLGDRELLIARGQRYAGHVARHTGRESGDLLDIGSAAGFLAKGFQTRGWRVQGLEPSLSMAAHATAKEDVPTSNDTVESFHTDHRFDLISMIQVIAHLPDPGAALAKAHQFLRPGGHLLIETWDNQSLTARALGPRWHEYNPPSVLHAFSRQSLHALAGRHGFHTVASKHTTKKLSAAHAKALIDHRYQGGRLHRYLLRPAMALVPDGVSVPYPADDLFWTILERT